MKQNYAPIVIRTFPREIVGPNETGFAARICGRATDSGRWEGWLEFTPEGGKLVLRSGRETTQPDFRNIELWASRLSRVYIEGSLSRTLEREGTHRKVGVPRRASDSAAYPGPAPSGPESDAPRPDDAPVNPFLLYSRGEGTLRSTLERLPASELRIVVRAYGLADEPGVDVATLSAGALVEMILTGVKKRVR